MAKKARRSKASSKRKVGKAKAQKKPPSSKKASRKAQAARAKKAAKKMVRSPNAAAPPPALVHAMSLAPAPAAPLAKPAQLHDPEILAAVGECVDKFMDNAPHPGWSNDDKVTKFKYTPVSIVGPLTIVQACLLPTYQFIIPKGFAKKCTSDTETILQMKFDISMATKKLPKKV
jgi:hypothetical protein